MNAQQNYLFLFADLIGSTEVAGELSHEEYARTYIHSLHWAFDRALRFISKQDAFPKVLFTKTIDQNRIILAGDEVFSTTLIDPSWLEPRQRKTLQDVVASAVSFAFLTKICWLLSPYNLRRMLSQQFPRDVAFGIHMGPATQVFDDRETILASLHINVAKRIEGTARKGKESRIFASGEVRQVFENWKSYYRDECKLAEKHTPPLMHCVFRPRDGKDEFKGVPTRVQLYELEWEESSCTLFTELLKPETEDIDAEAALKTFGEICLPVKGEISHIFGTDGHTQLEYIDHWFRAINNLPRIFFDETWQLLNYFLISCTFIRQPSVQRDRGKMVKYLDICDTLIDRVTFVNDRPGLTHR